MSLFFIASKILGVFLKPIWQCIFLTALSIIAKTLRWPGLSRIFLVSGFVLFCLYSFVPTSQILLRPLENYAAPPSESALTKAKGAIILGGYTGDGLVSASRNAPQFSSAAERFFAAIAVHQRFYDKPVWFSGFSGKLIQKGWSEDDITRRLLADLQLDLSDFYFEDRSRNTEQNARFTYQKIQPKTGESWILITSASHMMRAHLAFEKAGWTNLILMPVDYQTPRDGFDLVFDPLTGFRLMTGVFHEYFGLLVYKLTGRI